MTKHINIKEIKRLKKKAFNLRKKTFQAFIDKKEAHIGGSFSMIEIIVCLYEKIIKKNDKFILSKAHASFPLCLILRERGLNPKLSTHLELDEKNGIFCTTGSLGHGFPIAVGMALSSKIKKRRGNIYVLISDGECQEGTTWESLLIGNKHELSNLIVIVDYNKIQALTFVKDVLPLDDLNQKFKSFGWNCINIIKGHDFLDLYKGFKKVSKEKPNILIVNTVKGKGIKEFENDPVWHARKLTQNDIEIGKKRLQMNK